MQYADTAIQIYDVPTATDPDRLIDRRLALLVSALVVLALGAFAAFALFGIISQKL
jgi:hypothetical protein